MVLIESFVRCLQLRQAMRRTAVDADGKYVAEFLGNSSVKLRRLHACLNLDFAPGFPSQIFESHKPVIFGPCSCAAFTQVVLAPTAIVKGPACGEAACSPFRSSSDRSLTTSVGWHQHTPDISELKRVASGMSSLSGLLCAMTNRLP